MLIYPTSYHICLKVSVLFSITFLVILQDFLILPQFCSTPSLPLSSPHFFSGPKRKSKKLKPKQIKQIKIKKKPFYPLSFPFSNTPSLDLVALGAVVCHTAKPFLQSALLQIFIAGSHWSGSRPFVCGSPSSLDLHLSDILLLLQLIESLWVQFYRTRLQQDIDRTDYRVDHPNALAVDLGGSLAGQSRALGPAHSCKGWSQSYACAIRAALS